MARSQTVSLPIGRFAKNTPNHLSLAVILLQTCAAMRQKV